MSDQVLKCWVILKEPGKAPFKKQPIRQEEDSLIALLRDLISLYPDAAIIVTQLAYGNDLWVEDGKSYLRIHESMME